MRFFYPSLTSTLEIKNLTLDASSYSSHNMLYFNLGLDERDDSYDLTFTNSNLDPKDPTYI